jgi:type VI secretion system secreted protein Hcp
MQIARPALRLSAILLGLAAAALLLVFGMTRSVQTPTASAASSAYFLKIDGIDGESTDANHAGQIEINSWSFGVSNASTIGSATGGAGAGKAKFQDFHVTKRIDKATPLLALACAQGRRIPKATFVVARPGDGGSVDYYRVTLTNVLCDSFSQQGDQSDLPTETVSLNFGKLTVEYKPQKPDGTDATLWTTADMDAL